MCGWLLWLTTSGDDEEETYIPSVPRAGDAGIRTDVSTADVIWDVWSTILDDPLTIIITIYTGGDVYYLDGCYTDWRSRCIADPPLGNLAPE